MQGTRGSYQLAGTQGKREDFFFSPWFCGLYSQKSRISGVCVCVCVCVCDGTGTQEVVSGYTGPVPSSTRGWAGLARLEALGTYLRQLRVE